MDSISVALLTQFLLRTAHSDLFDDSSGRTIPKSLNIGSQERKRREGCISNRTYFSECLSTRRQRMRANRQLDRFINKRGKNRWLKLMKKSRGEHHRASAPNSVLISFHMLVFSVLRWALTDQLTPNDESKFLSVSSWVCVWGGLSVYEREGDKERQCAPG